MTNNYFLMQLP